MIKSDKEREAAQNFIKEKEKELIAKYEHELLKKKFT